MMPASSSSSAQKSVDESTNGNLLTSLQQFGQPFSLTMDFREQSHKETQNHLALALDNLRSTGKDLPDEETSLVEKEFNGYKDLFAHFLNAKARESIEWNKIEKLPGDAVSLQVNNQSE